MTDLENILPLWHELESAGADYVLATVVDVDGPSYRKPGARMLIAPTAAARARSAADASKRRSQSAHGGSPSRARWCSAIQRRKTMATCPTVPAAAVLSIFSWSGVPRRLPLLAALETAFHARSPLAIATVLDGADIAKRAFAGPTIPGRGTEITDTRIECGDTSRISPGWRSNGCSQSTNGLRSMGV